MRVCQVCFVVCSLCVFTLLLGCQDQSAPSAPVQGPNSTVTEDPTPEAKVDVDAGGRSVDVDVGGGERRRIRLPNVDVNIDTTPGGPADVDVNVQRRDDP